MEKTLPSGRAVTLKKISETTVRLIVGNPLLAKVFHGEIDLKSLDPDVALAIYEKLDQAVCRLVDEPRLFAPKDLGDVTPEGMVSTEDLDIEDKMAIFETAFRGLHDRLGEHAFFRPERGSDTPLSDS